MSNLYVLPKYHRRGIGTVFLDFAMDLFRMGIQLWTFQEITVARDFYRTRGFREVEFTDGVGNEEKLPDVRLFWNREISDY